MDNITNTTYLAALAGLMPFVENFARCAGQSYQQDSIVPQIWRPELEADNARVDGIARMAAGMKEESKERREGRGARLRLRSIFCSVTVDEGNAPEMYWPLKPLALEADTLFPQPQAELGDGTAAYQALWRDFHERAGALRAAHAQKGNLALYIESLLLLLQRYAWCIPGPYAEALPDVSLYDHARMTAALTACQVEAASEGPVALLVGGDISGVQDFIYTIAARGATSALRGRSFYLQLLTEAVARYTLRELKLPATNLIYQGGGGFYLLARPGDAGKLREIQPQISRVLLAHHRGDLYLALAHVPLATADFYGGATAGQWDALAQTLRRVKRRQFAELPAADLTRLFAAQGHGGDADKQCQVCGLEHPHTAVIKRRPADEAGIRKCPPCQDYEKWGQDLRNACYLWLDEIEPQAIPGNPLDTLPGKVNAVLAALGLRAGVAAELPRDEPPGGRVLLALNDAALRDLDYGPRTAIGRRFLVNVTPTIAQVDLDMLQGKVSELPNIGDVKDFSILAMQSQGIERLGVLRMDVDNLGKLFAAGLGAKSSLARTASLSFAISLYFEGWIGQLAETLNRECKPSLKKYATLYAIYSGGDDLFFVGAWDQVLDLARHIRTDLTHFAAHHLGIHASGGLVLIGGKYPLAQAAQEAGEAEHHAKSRDGKDAMSFLDLALPWAEFEETAILAQRLAEWVKSEQVSQSFLQHLRMLYTEWQEKHQGPNPAGPWIWHAVYQLHRVTAQNTAEKLRDEVTRWPQQMLADPRFIVRLGLAASWAALLTRK